MKKICSIFVVAGAALVFSSCKKDITDLNTNPTRPDMVTSASLFSNAEINLSDAMASTNVNTNNFRLWVQHWTETIYRDEARYNINGRSISDRWFATFYRDIIKDLTEASRVAATETANLSAAKIKNRKAVNEILIVYSYYTLLASFGNIPYDEALDIDNLQPKYDDAATVFGKLVTRLNAALGDLAPAAGAYGSADIILNDNLNRWVTFGNSLKLKMGMLVADSDPATSKTLVEAASPLVVMSNAENIKIQYLSSPPNTNPVWEDLVQSGRHDFVAAKPFVDTLLKYNDPRTKYFFDLPVNTSYANFRGQVAGDRATFNDFSAPATKISAPDYPHTFFSYAEMEFYKAEAAARGYSVGGTAATHYQNGVIASILEWGGTTAEANAYYAMPSVNYATAAGTYKQKIGLQAWIALYNRGFDAWTEWRRLDYPVLPVPTGSSSNFADGETPAVIKRMTYPVVEQNLNKASYDAASTAIGGDLKTNRLWFDKF